MYPLNQEKVLKRLPDVNKDYGGETIKEILNESVIDILTKYCGNDAAGKTNIKRGKKVAPGKSIAIDDIDYSQTSKQKKSKNQKIKGKKSKIASKDVESLSELEDIEIGSSGYPNESNDKKDVDLNESNQEKPYVNNFLTTGSWHVVAYPRKTKKCVKLNYIGQIVEVLPTPEILYMRFRRKVDGSKNLFNYPVAEDIVFAAHFSSICNIFNH